MTVGRPAARLVPVVLLLVLACLLASPAVAGAAAADARDADEAITVAPSVLFVDADPGQTVERDVVVSNATSFAAAFTGRAVDIARFPGGGEPLDFVEAGTQPRSAAAWMQPDPSGFRLGAVSQRTVRLAFAVPPDARPGGHYAALLLTAQQLGGAGDVRVDAAVPVTVLLTVSGEFRRGLEADLRAADTWRWGGGAATWQLTLRNTGDVHENVSGRVRVEGLLGEPRSTPVDPGILLPGEERSQPVELDLRAAPDAYSARVSVDRDDGRDVVAEAERVVVLPWWLLVLVAAAVVVVTWRLRVVRGAAHRHRLDDDGAEH